MNVCINISLFFVARPVERQSMHVDKDIEEHIWLLTEPDKMSDWFISPLIKLNISGCVGGLPPDISLPSDMYLTCFFSILVSHFLFYISCLRSVLYVFSCLVFFSFCLFFPFPFSRPPSGLSVSTSAFSSWSLSGVPSFSSTLLSFSHSLPFLLSFPSFFVLCSAISLDLSLSFSRSLTPSVSHPNGLNSLERFSRWRAVKPATTTWVYHQFLKINA